VNEDSTSGHARRAVVLTLVAAAAFLAQPVAAAAQDTYIITTTIVETGTFGQGGAASADLLRGSGVVDGTSGTASTGSDSLMQLTMNDGSGEALLGSHSSLSLDGGGGDGGGSDGGGGDGGGGDGNSASVTGQSWWRVQSKFEIKMPVAVIGIRGTTFTAEARSNWARVRTYEGAVTFQNLRGPIRTVTVRAGYESVVRGDTRPTRPKRFRYPSNPFWE
jgi:hypothetical protein